jgi:flagellar hook-length control protein FliK
MDAIALSMFVEPAAMPTPRSETSLLDASFDALVATESGEEPEVEDAPDAPSDDATSQSDLMSAIVSQWLGQTDNAATSFPGREIQDEQADAIQREPAAAPEETDEPELSPENPLPTGATNVGSEEAEAGDQIAQKSEDSGGPSPDGDAIPLKSSPSEGETPVAPRARNEEPKVPFLQLMQQAAEIGWTLPSLEASRVAIPTTVTKAVEPRQGSAENLAPARVAQATTAFSTGPAETASAREPATPRTAPEAPVGHDAKSIDPDQTKPTKSLDRSAIPEQPAATHAATRAPESLVQTSPNPPANAPPSSQPQTPDTISIPPPATASAAAESSADMPVKLVAASREGQAAEMQTLALHIAARSAKGDSKFTIRLDPPELGQIDVNLSVNSHGHAQAVLAVEKPQTLDLLMRDAPTLEKALKDAGLELGGDLSFSLKEEGQQGFARDDQYAPSTKALELVSTEAPKAQAALNASLVEQLYGLRTARLDITV